METPTCITVQRGTGGHVDDTFIKANLSRWNFGWMPYLIVSEKEESLLRFDLSWLPPGAAISKATLKIYVAGAFGGGKTEFRRALVPWNERTVTFASFGQRFSSEIAAEARLDSATAQKSIDLTTLVKAWTSGTPNYGFVVRPGSDHHPRSNRWEDDDGDPTIFVASENPFVARRPALEVCYTLPVTDHCAANPCENGGTCANTDTGYTCSCAAGYDGTNCEHNINDCASNPCQNGGSCADGVNGYTCTCPAGYGGANCESNIDDCSPNPCQNGGTCTDGVASHTCHCEPGYDGANCEHLIDNCDPQPCHNGGTCSNDVNGYTCSCAAGYTGATCDINIDDCASNPCQNGGTCLDGVDSFTCSCAPGYTGATCDVNIDDCANSPCLNGGLCQDGVDAFTCTCQPGYTGTHCEVDIDDCNPNPCQNAGTCIDGVNTFTCECKPGYVGPICEFDACTQMSCDDSNACTADSCAQGVCSHAAISCDDNSPCTVDRCDAAIGCVHDAVTCDDSSACTADSCGPNGCQYAAISCDDNNQCTADSCDPIAGCLHNAISCDDNNPCTVDACDPTQGCVHSPLSCDDNDACTTDTCGPQGCQHAAITCNDGNACTSDTCDPQAGCVTTTPDPTCKTCSANNECTSSVCLDGRCCQGDFSVGGQANGTNVSFCSLDGQHLDIEIRVGVGTFTGTVTAPNNATIPFSGNASTHVEIPSSLAGVYRVTVSTSAQVSSVVVPPDMTVDAGPGAGFQQVTLTNMFQHARYTFVESAGGRVYITSQGPAPSSSARLISPSGTVLRSDFLFNFVDVPVTLTNESGKYTLDIMPSGVPQTITLSIADLPPDPILPVDIDGSVKTATLSRGQTAHFNFSSPGRGVDIVFSMPPGALATLLNDRNQPQFFATTSGYRRVDLGNGTWRLDIGGVAGTVSMNVVTDPADAPITYTFGGPPASYTLAPYQGANIGFTAPAGSTFIFSHDRGTCQNEQLFGPTGALVAVVPGCIPTTRPVYAPQGGVYAFHEIEDAVSLNPTLGATSVPQLDGNQAGPLFPVSVHGADGVTTNAAVVWRDLQAGQHITVTALVAAGNLTAGTTYALFDERGTLLQQGTGLSTFVGAVTVQQSGGAIVLVVTTSVNNQINVSATSP